MRFTSLVTAGALALLPAGADAAQVSGAIIIGGGPVGGVITIGQPVIVRPRERVVVVERYPPPRVIVVERWKRHRHHPRHFVRRVVYWDRRYDRFYERHRPGLIQVAVFFGDGRYYFDDDWYERSYRRYYEERYRGHRDWDDRRYRDRDWDRDRDRYRDRDRDRDRDWDRDRDRDDNRDWDRDRDNDRREYERARPRERRP